MVTYIRWYSQDEDLWCYDELDNERQSTRHAEARAPNQTFVAAASLAEVLEARDSGDHGRSTSMSTGAA